ncbi:hypothetical protein [Nocardia sp. NBC_01327]|uniref:hypothetical protein n=1 Tax=Nocardia sp. NBC_01327 TaxID=2903593 RepID=UPI002E165810|nr:hypothetical protein OG326_42385 [Nocardia sp. NBC_01327]
MIPYHDHGEVLVNLPDVDGDLITLARDRDGYLRVIVHSPGNWETWVRLDEVSTGFLEFALRRERLTPRRT